MADINFNKSDFQVLADSMDETFPELLSVFFHETETAIDSIKSHIENQDWTAVNQLGHSLKSSTKTFGAVGLSETSYKIEMFEPNQKADIDQLYQTFVAEYQQVKKRIQALQS